MTKSTRIPKSLPDTRYAWTPVKREDTYNETFSSIEECIKDATNKFNDEVYNCEHFPIAKGGTYPDGPLDPFINIGVVRHLDIEKLKHDAAEYCLAWIKEGESLDELPQHMVDYLEDAITTELGVAYDGYIIDYEEVDACALVNKLSKLGGTKFQKIQKITDHFMDRVSINVTESAMPLDPIYNVQDHKWYNWKTLEVIE